MAGKNFQSGDQLFSGERFDLDPSSIPFATDGMDCPSYYADAIRGTVILGETTKITLVENRLGAHTDSVQAVHVAQIVIPTSQVRVWGEYFSRIADEAGLPPIVQSQASTTNG